MRRGQRRMARLQRPDIARGLRRRLRHAIDPLRTDVAADKAEQLPDSPLGAAAFDDGRLHVLQRQRAQHSMQRRAVRDIRHDRIAALRADNVSLLPLVERSSVLMFQQR